MLLKMFTIRDARAKAYMQPFFSLNSDTAIRSVEMCLRDPNHEFSKNPNDYSVYEIGEYDDTTGMVEPGVQPEYVCNLVDLIKGNQEEDQLKLEAV